ncbi:2-C-methyl-D-erythritol 2,4-cyclodiphosphate synthase, partial [Vibrio harveyi]
SNLLL